MNATAIKDIVEAALMACDQPLTVERLMALFEPDGPPDTLRDDIEHALAALAEDYARRGIEIIQVARGVFLLCAPCSPPVNGIEQQTRMQSWPRRSDSQPGLLPKR